MFVHKIIIEHTKAVESFNNVFTYEINLRKGINTNLREKFIKSLFGCETKKMIFSMRYLFKI